MLQLLLAGPLFCTVSWDLLSLSDTNYLKLMFNIDGMDWCRFQSYSVLCSWGWGSLTNLYWMVLCQALLHFGLWFHMTLKICSRKTCLCTNNVSRLGGWRTFCKNIEEQNHHSLFGYLLVTLQIWQDKSLAEVFIRLQAFLSLVGRVFCCCARALPGCSKWFHLPSTFHKSVGDHFPYITQIWYFEFH